MQQKEIRYTGMTTRPTDNNSPDGELDICYNLVNEDGALKPMFPPKFIFSIPDYKKLFCIHKVNNTENYIVYNSKNELLSYKFTGTTLESGKLICILSDINLVVCVGATLSITTNHTIVYAVLKEGNYIFLNEKPPFLDLSFGLHGSMIVAPRFTSVDINTEGGFWGSPWESNPPYNGNYYTWIAGGNKDKLENEFTNRVFPQVNKFIQENSIDQGKFIFPFFVRYAYRMYDGTHIMHSPPVLLIPNRRINAFLVNYKENDARSETNWSHVAAMVCTLDYIATVSQETLDTVKKWSDLIKEIDIFISAPIYTYDQNGKVTGWTCYDPTGVNDTNCGVVKGIWEYDNYSHAKLDTANSFNDTHFSDCNDNRLYNKKRTFAQLWIRTYGHFMEPSPNEFETEYNESGKTKFTCPSLLWALPEISEEKITENLSNCSLFYKAASIDINTLTSNKATDVKITPEILKTLQQRERLEDDYQSHTNIIAGYAYNYNARLYVANISQGIFNGFRASTMFQRQLSAIREERKYTVYVHLKKEGRDIVVKQSNVSLSTGTTPYYLFYPDSDAYKMILSDNDSSTNSKEFKLTPHALLNGSYWFDNFKDITLTSHTLPQVNGDTTIYLPNRLYASEINNPFFFPLKNRNTIGTSKIIAVTSASKALSQGQFGQFPLYAFTADGVWALEISNTGDLSAKQPATRDVITSSESLLQIDGGIVFSTAQGIMLLSGSESVCLSEVIDEHTFNTMDLPHITELLKIFGMEETEMNIIPFKEYSKDCKLSYDYANSRLLIFNPSKTYGYIYSLKSHNWTLFNSTYQDTVNDYPTSLVVDMENNVYDLGELNKLGQVKGLIISRPLKLDAPDTLKTVTSSVHRMIGAKESTPTALYGSIDCEKFHLVATSADKFIRSTHGSPYSYFVFAIGTDFKNGDSLSGTSLTYDIKRNNKLR